ncbi:MAG: nucleotidyltransferase domain-containing protein [Chloroflexi bacterium]|jgi:uncharacterized protein|nr:nucleotidyltransferase domain-containing protein [Chloroflexota bacterium]
MIDLPEHLQTNEKQAILKLCLTLSEMLGRNLVDMVLFGSKARGDFHPDSDIDLLVVLRHLNADSRWLVRSVAADCSLEYDVLFNTHLYEKGRWEAMMAHRDTLWREVQRDGMPLRDLLAQPIS